MSSWGQAFNHFSILVHTPMPPFPHPSFFPSPFFPILPFQASTSGISPPDSVAINIAAITQPPSVSSHVSAAALDGVVVTDQTSVSIFGPIRSPSQSLGGAILDITIKSAEEFGLPASGTLPNTIPSTTTSVATGS